jgi:hypothetical protein
VGGGGEARHVHADLGQDHLRDEVTHAGHRRQEVGPCLDRRQRFSQRRIDLAEGGLEGGHHVQVQREHHPVMRGGAAAERLDELGPLLARGAVGERGESDRIVHAGDERSEHRAPTDAQDIGEDTRHLDVGVLQDLLDPERVLRDLPHQLPPRAREVAELLDGRGRHETAPDQPVREQVGEPHRIVHVRLPAGHIADVLGIGQDEGEAASSMCQMGFQ